MFTEINKYAFILIFPLLFGCQFQPDGAFDNKLSVKNEAEVDIMISISLKCDSMTLNEQFFPIDKGEENTCPLTGDDVWENLLNASGCFYLKAYPASFFDSTKEQMEKAVFFKTIIDSAMMDSMDWHLTIPK